MKENQIKKNVYSCLISPKNTLYLQ